MAMFDFQLVMRVRRYSRNLSLRAALFAAGALASALGAVALAPLVPVEMAEWLGGEAASSVLDILTSSMLTVVTFSLTTLLAAYGTVASTAPPRALTMIVDDSSAHTALSTFLGAFIFGVVSRIALTSHYYGRPGRAILFLISLGILVLVIVTMIRWIGRLTNLVRLTHSIDRLAEVTVTAARKGQTPIDWNEAAPGAPACSRPVSTERSGFVRSIAWSRLEELATRHDLHVVLNARTGDYVAADDPVLKVDRELPASLARDLGATVLVGPTRTFDDDPRFGFLVLSEIASKALSPAISDPGSAIQVLAATTGAIFKILDQRTALPASPRVHRRPVAVDEIFDDAFRPVARDGAGLVEVAVFLQKRLVALSGHEPLARAAERASRDGLARSELAMTYEPDLRRVRAAAIVSRKGT